MDSDVDELLSGLTRFLLRHSAEGAFELRNTVRAVGRAYGAQAELLALTEGAVLTVRHPDAPVFPRYRPVHQALNASAAAAARRGLGQRATSARSLIRDHAGQFTASLDAVLTAAGIMILPSPPQAPRANAICERTRDCSAREHGIVLRENTGL